MNPRDEDPELSLRLLEIFAAMMRSQTTTEAAEMLRISQPAVSAALRQLEVNLGLTLFERTTRRLVPTSEARMLYEEIRPIFGLMRGVAQRTREMKQGLVGRLRVLSTHPLGNSIAPIALRNFLADRPDVSISFDVRRLDQVIEAVQNGMADLGLAVLPAQTGSTHAELLCRAQMVALVPEDDPLAGKSAITGEDLAGRPLVGIEQESELGQLLRRGFVQTGAEYRPRIESRLCQTAALLASHGIGCAVVDPWSASVYPMPGLVRRPFLPALEVQAVVLTRRGVPHSDLLHSFVAELRARVQDPIGL